MGPVPFYLDSLRQYVKTDDRITYVLIVLFFILAGKLFEITYPIYWYMSFFSLVIVTIFVIRSSKMLMQFKFRKNNTELLFLLIAWMAFRFPLVFVFWDGLSVKSFDEQTYAIPLINLFVTRLESSLIPTHAFGNFVFRMVYVLYGFYVLLLVLLSSRLQKNRKYYIPIRSDYLTFVVFLYLSMIYCSDVLYGFDRSNFGEYLTAFILISVFTFLNFKIIRFVLRYTGACQKKRRV